MFDHHGQGSSGLFQRQVAVADNLTQSGSLQPEDNLCSPGTDWPEVILHCEQQQLTELVSATHYLEDNHSENLS